MKATLSKPVLIRLTVVLVILLFFFAVCASVHAETGVYFTSEDKFSIPELNGSISFSLNGSCSAAIFENDTWIFTDLKFNMFSESVPETLKVSTENSNVTILSYLATNTSIFRLRLSYAVQGEGKQAINLCLLEKTKLNEWAVNLDGHPYVNEGHGWKLLPDDSLVITGALHNATITHYTYVDDGNLPFLQRHSIALVTLAVVALTLTLALLIRVKVRR